MCMQQQGVHLITLQPSYYWEADVYAKSLPGTDCKRHCNTIEGDATVHVHPHNSIPLSMCLALMHRMDISLFCPCKNRIVSEQSTAAARKQEL
jgi:hypothetical protein